ncbi:MULTISPECIES: DUF6980 family protein [Leeuwenhoekiella]|jgi:hypothetical protein|uniref:DUF6980 family protein n=1 Tax=Leeuwenhoekiella TaxID=283735 RepID=UPI000C3BB099|nr:MULTISPECIES: hypothetical protein [Leeuwenhoekiella]MAO43465.1 hypothetical protein [Leeuwenhoekiella sp.]HBT09998.1 hypothetical protein [Leeuwenhoekiella sp.]|tara:strand:- start:1616 stop:1999 length:384 start_codon:yes stop_codon:yes gene_type:complete
MTFEEFKILHQKFTSDLNGNVKWNDPEYNKYIDEIHENIEFHEWTLKEKFRKNKFNTESICCLQMADKIFDSLDKKRNIKYGDVDVVINKWTDGTYGIPIHDGGTSIIEINFCPWCGQNLTDKKASR